MLIHPERLDEIEAALGAAAQTLAGLDDAAGEAKAHTVRAVCLARLGRIGDCEVALDDALTAARRARDHRRVNAVLAGAPLAALWGPNPVPRAGGRCLDVVRLLRITTDSPAVEATSTRCQAVLEAFRGRAEAARRMIDSARRTVTELGLRHALQEVEQFAGIVELVVDDPAAAEPRLRQAYNAFRRMGLDADTAETAALLGRACLALGRDAEADELCTESERLAGNALKASIAWRTLRAQLLARSGDHAEARRIAEAAVALAERTDLLVDHGDACLGLATVLQAAGNVAGARAAASRAVDLYERKGAAALAEKARRILGAEPPPAPVPPEVPRVEFDNACVRAGERVAAAINREAWDQFEQLFAPDGLIESRRKIVGFGQIDVPPGEFPHVNRRVLETVPMRVTQMVIAVRGERLALARLVIGADDVSPGAPQDEFLLLYGIDEGGQISLQVWFDLEDIDAAMAELDAAYTRFEAEYPPVRRLENKAALVFEHVWSHFAARDWSALAETVSDNYSGIDHRRVVNAGIQHGRDAVVTDLQAAADVGFTISMLSAIAIRGDRLVLARVRASGRDPEAIENDALNVVEIDTDERIAAAVTFDLEDFDAAIAELDARYLAGEAAAHAQTWSALLRAFAAFNRRELPSTTPDWVNIDHRRGRAFSPGDLIPYINATWEVAPQAMIYVESVHRLSNLGAVVTQSTRGTSPDGFDAEWLEVTLLTIEGDLMSRCEVFDEEEIGAAIAKFERLSRPAPRLENAASQVAERLLDRFDVGDWDAIAEILADDFCGEDRRRVVGAGVQNSRDVELASIRAGYDLGGTTMTSTVIATRGARLILTRTRHSGPNQAPDAFLIDVLAVVEINADNRIAARIVFEPDDFDAAIAELDARYLAREAAVYSHTWSLIIGAYAALNRREVPPTTPDWVDIDRRRSVTIEAGGMKEYLRAAFDATQNVSMYIEAVHRLSDSGAVVTHTAHGTSQEGFDAEWRVIDVLTFEGDLIDRSEVFDEADVEVALARFEELHRPPRRLENAASQAAERLRRCFTARDWEGLAEILAEDILADDRRRIVGTGVRRGRQANVADIRVGADVGTEDITSTVIATRGDRIALDLARFSASDQLAAGLNVEVLRIVEVDTDNQMTCCLMFDVDDLESAIAELDARYLAGEAAPHSRTWSAITLGYGAFNRREGIATTEDWVNIDHRRAVAVAPGELTAYVHAAWDLEQDVSIYIEAVHRLSNLGAVVTHATYATSTQGFAAEWRMVLLVTVDGNVVNHCEVFDEADLDTAIAQFDELSPQTRGLENAASQARERLQAHFAVRDWDAITEIIDEDICTDDRRKVVNSGLRQGREAVIAEISGATKIGVASMTSDVIATRGGSLVLGRAKTWGRDRRPEAFHTDVLDVLEINADGKLLARVVFDLDDIDAAFEELDARYLAGQAAPHARTWSLISASYAALNRREHPATTPDWVSIDHRRGVSFPAGQVSALLANWITTPDLSNFVAAVHRLNDFGAVVTSVTKETSREGFEAEWRGISVLTIEGDLIDRLEIFDEADLDAALARFEELSQPVPRLENPASQVYERSNACFAAHDWDALAETFADDISTEDRRRVVGAAVLHGRDAVVANAAAIVDFGMTNVTSTVIATRGKRLALARARYSGTDQEPGAFHTDILGVLESNADNRIVAHVIFDPDDIDAAFDELDARYLAGEAAVHARTWSVITRAYAALNRRELPPTTPDWVNIDHRRGTSFASGEMPALLDAAWNFTTDLSHAIETVHRLNDLGAVVTNVSHETSQEGTDAEWRVITVGTVDGDMLSRCEIFDEADLDAALARFEELHSQTPRLENVASQVAERFLSNFAVRDWDAMEGLLAADICTYDRRRVVNDGIRRGRDVEMANWRATGDIWLSHVTSTVMATRGKDLALLSLVFTGQDQPHEAFYAEALAILEINDDNRIARIVVIEPDEVKAAFAELEARYLVGQAAAYSRTWSVIASSFAAFNRHEVPAADWVTIDHRRGTPFERSNMTPSIRTIWDLTPDLNIDIEEVHRLNTFGAVITHRGHGTSQEGFDAEWLAIDLFVIDGDVISRCEIFDETDLDAALARFEELHGEARELHPQASRLENTASLMNERFWTHFAARDWDAMAELTADNICSEDRRRVVNGGVRHGREAHIADMRVIAEIVDPQNLTPTVIATRGARLALSHIRSSNRVVGPDEITAEVLSIVEIDADNRIVADVGFDPNDLDAAFEELDARYLAGEAAPHAQTWSVIARECAAFNRHQLPAANWVTVDHRQLAVIDAREGQAAMRDIWEVTPDLSMRIEAVHRLSSFGAVSSYAASGTSPEGLDVEWPMILLLTLEGDRINRCEIFDEADLDAALARFGELQPQGPRLENAASQVGERFLTRFAARDWEAMAELLADDYSSDDRRGVVGAGVRHGRDAQIADLRAIADLWITNVKMTVIATRGERLVLTRTSFSGRDQGSEAFLSDVLDVAEISADGRYLANVSFDLDDFDSAIAELDARYLAGEAAAHARSWSVIACTYAGFNRHEFPPMTPDSVSLDHRRLVTNEAVDLAAATRSVWDVAPDLSVYIATVHRLSELGAVVTHIGHGTSPDGFDAEWWMVNIFTVEGDLISRCEIFDEADLDAALARFEELHPQARRLESAVTLATEGFMVHFATRDWDSMAATLAADISVDDRRRGINAGTRHGRNAAIEDLRASVDAGFTDAASTVIATRGDRLGLARVHFSERSERPGTFRVDVFHLIETNADGQTAAVVVFDVDDIDAAFMELDARYLAGEAAAHSHMWTLVTHAYEALNKRQLPKTTSDWVNIDHRRLAPIATGDLGAYLLVTWDATPQSAIRIEAVHRLSKAGAVVTHLVEGTSELGFDAEWRTVALVTFDGDKIDRCELFDEDGLDAALARFDELDRPQPPLENGAALD